MVEPNPVDGRLAVGPGAGDTRVFVHVQRRYLRPGDASGRATLVASGTTRRHGTAAGVPHRRRAVGQGTDGLDRGLDDEGHAYI